MQYDGHLDELLGCHAAHLLLEMVHGAEHDWVGHPVYALRRLADAQLMQGAKELSHCKVLVVIEVEQDLIASHLLEVDEVVDRDRLMHEERTTFGRVYFDSCLAGWLLTMYWKH